MKKIVIVFIGIVIIVAASIVCVSELQKDTSKEHGKNAKKHSREIDKNNKYIKYRLAKKGIYSSEKTTWDGVFEIGKDVLVTKEEIETIKKYYRNMDHMDHDEKKMEKEALKSCEENNAIYAEAIKAGFDVTQKEVDEFIAKGKKISKMDSNKEEFKIIIRVFGKEKDYWKYETKQHKKWLPIMNYRKSLENKLKEKYRTKYTIQEIEKMSDKKFAKMKKRAAQRQHYTKVDDNTKISKLTPFWVR